MLETAFKPTNLAIGAIVLSSLSVFVVKLHPFSCCGMQFLELNFIGPPFKPPTLKFFSQTGPIFMLWYAVLETAIQPCNLVIGAIVLSILLVIIAKLCPFLCFGMQYLDSPLGLGLPPDKQFFYPPFLVSLPN